MMRYLLAGISMYVLFYMVGGVYLSIRKMKMDFFRQIISGLLITSAFFECLAIPFMVTKAPFMLLYYTFLASCLVVIFLFIRFCVVKGTLNIGNNLRAVKSNVTLYYVAFFALLTLQVFVSVWFCHSDADDGFYVSTITTMINDNKIFGCNPTYGWKVIPYLGQYQLVGYEVFLAQFVKLFNVNAAMYLHTLLPAVWIPIHYIVQYEVARTIFPKRKSIYMLLMAVYNVMGGFTIYNSSTFLGIRSWQGKASLVNVVFPLIFLLFYKLYKDGKWSVRRMAEATVLLVSCVFFSAVGVYLGLILFGCLGLVYFILDQKRLRTFGYYIVPCLFNLLIGVGAVYIARQDSLLSGDLNRSLDTLSYSKIFECINGQSAVLALVVLSILLLLITKRKMEIKLLIAPIVVLFLTFLNPLFMKIVAKYVTGAPVYWRLTWLIPIPYLIITAVLVLVEHLKKEWQIHLAVIMTIAVFVLNGQFLYTSNYFSERENGCKLPQDVVAASELILADHSNKNRAVMIPWELTRVMRQYSGELTISYETSPNNREFCNQAFGADYFDDYNYLYEKLYVNTNEKAEKLSGLLRKHGFGYVIIKNEPNPQLDGPFFQCIGKTENYLIYSCRSNES